MKTAIKLRLIDCSNEVDQALLTWLQLKALPSDVVADSSYGYWWIAELDKRPIAFAGMHASHKYEKVGYLCRAGVLEEFRGMGLQKRLIRVRMRKAKSLKWEWLITDTCETPQSSNSLISCGFKLFTPSSPWGLDKANYWRKRISE